MTEELLAFLRTRANRKGLVLVREAVLRERLSATREGLAHALDELAQAGKIRLLSPLPYVALRLLAWSGEPPNVAIPHSKLLPSPSDSKAKSYRAKAESHADGLLLKEILETLGETDPTTFHGLFDHYSEGVIRKALERVRQAGSIRKSRTALFRYLLVKLAPKPHVPI